MGKQKSYAISLKLAYKKLAQNTINILTDCECSDWSIYTQGDLTNYEGHGV